MDGLRKLCRVAEHRLSRPITGDHSAVRIKCQHAAVDAFQNRGHQRTHALGLSSLCLKGGICGGELLHGCLCALALHTLSIGERAGECSDKEKDCILEQIVDAVVTHKPPGE